MKFLFSHIPSWLKNKFLIAAIIFLAWILFFDEKDLITGSRRRNELKELKISKTYYIQEIAKEQKALEELRTDPAAIEKFAREKYLMKRDNEELFLIRNAEKD